RAAADPAEKKQQIEKIEKDLDREREQLLRFDEKEEKLLEELSHLEKEIEEKRKNLKELEEKVSVIKKDLRENQAKMSQLEKSLKALEDRLGKRLDAFYRYAKRGYIRLLATADGLDTLRKRFKYLRALLAVDLTLLQETADLQKQYREEIASVKEKLLDLEGLEKEESVRVAAVKEDIDRKVVLLMKTHKEKEFLETGVKELELASQKLKETLIQIEKRDEKRTEIPSDFANARGKLPMPIDGRILREGASSQGGLKGITIEGRPGAEVKAVYAGRIDFSGTLKGYGELVVINHGSRYFTVSAHLAQREKQEGEMVKSGEVIGSLGKTATPREARLYFEIRKGGGTLDPIRWLKVH
ncbi:MAG: peptidoglycan DD-metalloendopeptidase family protein, partial [Deltaproteobacteria bacterium]|nr:peptidoglycan DD-metalloendopeptidase family protein [Deltaproteobacteria bacterium]